MYLNGIGRKGVGWFQLAYARVQLQALLCTVVNLLLP
jgi:hypothetical protein